MSESESQETTTANKSWLVRAYHTPLSDALRGQLSARLDVHGEITSADLPAPVGQLIWRVARRTRLWRRERIDVARELIAHFSDGLTDGRTAEELVADFGDAKTAAKLIRKAKLRNRPLWWQTWWVGSRLFAAGLGAAILVYAFWMIRFHIGHPTLARDYWREVNDAHRAPQNEQAWPYYREADEKRDSELGDIDFNWNQARPPSDNWNKLVTIVGKNRKAIELTRKGAGKPRLGALVDDDADDHDSLYMMVLDHIQAMRGLARLVLADALVAAASDEGERTLKDIRAMLLMTAQLDQPKASLVEQLVAMAIFSLTMDVTRRVLAEHPEAFTEDQLRDLAHTIAGYRDNVSAIDVEFERMAFLDFLQRAYTDDGHGEGRITPEGLVLLDSYATSSQGLFAVAGALSRQASSDRRAAVGAYLLNPGVAATIGGRRANRELYDSYLDGIVRAHKGPPWQWDEQSIKGVHEKLYESSIMPMGRMRYLPVFLSMPAIDSAYQQVERMKQITDATQVAIALELWHRRHSVWPASLDELVPDLLPAVPPDRLDGQPLRYALRDGKPVVYSIGVDRDDDDGQPIASGPYVNGPIYFGRPTPDSIQRYQSPDYDGDWILWPPRDEPEPDDVE